jgi:hypothetical protein
MFIGAAHALKSSNRFFVWSWNLMSYFEWETQITNVSKQKPNKIFRFKRKDVTGVQDTVSEGKVS